MKLTKVTQVYLSIVSVLALSVIGAGGYIWQTGQAPVSRADVASNATEPPVLRIVSDRSALAIDQEAEISVFGDFTADPVIGANLLFSYPSDLLEVTQISQSPGLLDVPTQTSLDPDSGTVSLSFKPLSGVVDQGKLTTIKVKAKKPGLANLNLEIASQLAGVLPTTISTPTDLIVTPKVIGTNIVIE